MTLAVHGNRVSSLTHFSWHHRGTSAGDVTCHLPRTLVHRREPSKTSGGHVAELTDAMYTRAHQARTRGASRATQKSKKLSRGATWYSLADSDMKQRATRSLSE